MKWICSTGGPSIVIAAGQVHKWSGIGAIGPAMEGEYEEAEDWLDPEQSHYGLACEMEDMIGVVWIDEGDVPVIVVGDEPAQMTVLDSPENDGIIVVKWGFGDSEEELESYLDYKEMDGLESWQPNLSLALSADEYLLMDSSELGFDLENDAQIRFKLREGNYRISSLAFNPDPRTSMHLHRLKLI